jgi:hypothetical protein
MAGLSNMQAKIEENLHVKNPLFFSAAVQTIILDTRGCAKWTPFFAGGAHTYQLCNEQGTPVAGAATAFPATGTAVTVLGPFYRLVLANNDVQISRHHV